MCLNPLRASGLSICSSTVKGISIPLHSIPCFVILSVSTRSLSLSHLSLSSVTLYIYIYIYNIYVCVCVCIYIYIYIARLILLVIFNYAGNIEAFSLTCVSIRLVV